MDVIAEETLFARFPDGSSGLISFRVGRPVPCSEGGTACPVEAAGLPGWNGPTSIFGEGSLHALSLGIRFLSLMMIGHKRLGVVFYWPDTDDVVGTEIFGESAPTG